MPYDLCLEDDWYVRNIPRWVATLTDGLVVYGDDDREGVAEPSAWVRLRSYCLEQGVGIAKMHFQFRSNVVHLPPGKQGYFFVRTANGMDGGTSFPGARVGYVEGDEVFTVHFRVPEVQAIDSEVRSLDRESECVIMRPDL